MTRLVWSALGDWYLEAKAGRVPLWVASTGGWGVDFDEWVRRRGQAADVESAKLAAEAAALDFAREVVEALGYRVVPAGEVAP